MTNSDHIANLFKALSDPNRVRILSLLLEQQEMCVCDIERILEIPQSRVSRHLQYLRQEELVCARREGLWMFYSLAQESELYRTLFTWLASASEHADDLQRDRAALRNDTDLCCPKTEITTISLPEKR